MMQDVIDVITVNNVVNPYARVTSFDQPIKFQFSLPPYLRGLATFLLCGFTSLSLFISFFKTIIYRLNFVCGRLNFVID